MSDFGLFWICCLVGFSDKFAAKIISVAILSRSNHKMIGLIAYGNFFGGKMKEKKKGV